MHAFCQVYRVVDMPIIYLLYFYPPPVSGYRFFLARYAWVRFVRLFVGLWIRSSVPQNPLTSSKDHFVIPGTGMFAVHRTADIIVIVCNVTVLYLISWLDKDVLIWYIPNVLAPVIKLSRMFTCLYCRMLNNLAATSLISDSDQSGQRCREWK